MEIALAVVGVFMLILGFIGCFVPVLPGPPLAFISLVLLQFGPEKPFSLNFMIITGVMVLVVTLLDYIVPAMGTKKWGGSRIGMLGAFIGIVLGLFVFPPFGFLIFPLLGAIIGEILNGADTNKAMKSALGTLIGLIFGIVMKLSVTLYVAFYFFRNL